MLVTILIFIAFISFLVIVHELGHFLAAKWLGVGVEKFAIGFPPKIWSKKIGETEYSVNAILLGGYVKLVGENEGDNQAKNSYMAKTPLVQLIILVSGVAMNLAVGILLLWLALMIGTQPILSGVTKMPGIVNGQKVVINDVEKNTPAEKEGLKGGDVILKVDGQSVSQDSDVMSIIQGKVGQNGAKVDVEVQRGSETINKTISTYKSKVKTNKGETEVNRIGILLSTEGKVSANPINAFIIAVRMTAQTVAVTLLGIFNLFKLILTQFKLSPDISGPVGIVMYTSYFSKLGFTSFMQFVALISITLAVFNILPIPALDGGQIFFTLIEVASNRKFSDKTKSMIQLAGFSALILLMIAVTIKDVINIF